MRGGGVADSSRAGVAKAGINLGRGDRAKAWYRVESIVADGQGRIHHSHLPSTDEVHLRADFLLLEHRVATEQHLRPQLQYDGPDECFGALLEHGYGAHERRVQMEQELVLQIGWQGARDSADVEAVVDLGWRRDGGKSEGGQLCANSGEAAYVAEQRTWRHEG